jgi:twinkle protein
LLINPSDFRNLNVQEELSDRVIDEVALPQSLVQRALERRDRVDDGATAPWSKLRGLVALRPQELVVVAGYNGHSKSSVMAQWLLHAANEGKRTAIMSLEMDAAYVFDTMAGMAAVRQEAIPSYLKEFALWCETDNRIAFIDRQDMVTPEEVLQTCIGMRKFYDTDIVLIDCLAQVGLNSEDYDGEKKFISALSAIAKTYGMCIVLVMHVRKPGASRGGNGEQVIPGKYELMGSSNISNLASTIIVVWSDKEKAAAKNAGEEVSDDDPDAVISICKQRYFNWEGRVGLYKHAEARVLCNSRARRYRPVEIRRDNKEEFLSDRSNGTDASGGASSGDAQGRSEVLPGGRSIPGGGRQPGDSPGATNSHWLVYAGGKTE